MFLGALCMDAGGDILNGASVERAAPAHFLRFRPECRSRDITHISKYQTVGAKRKHFSFPPVTHRGEGEKSGGTNDWGKPARAALAEAEEGETEKVKETVCRTGVF